MKATFPTRSPGKSAPPQRQPGGRRVLLASFLSLLLTVALSQRLASERNAGGQVPGTEVDPWDRVIASYISANGPAQGFAAWLQKEADRRSDLAPGAAARVERAEKELAGYVHSSVGRSGIPGAALAIYRDGAPMAALDQGFQQTSVVSVASVAKTFTAVAVLQLVDQGKLGLDDDIGRYFPELSFATAPVGGVPVTVRHLLNHTSGLPYGGGGGGVNVASPVRGIVYYIPGQYRAAGEGHFYSNFNYNLLACLIEKLSGQTYPEYVRDHILLPAGMRHSRMIDGANGAAGLNASVADLSRFAMALFNDRAPRRLISEAMLREMIAPPSFLKGRPGPNDMYYALGVRVQYRNGQPAEVYHTGVWYNTFAEVRYFLNERSAVVHVANPPNFRSPDLLAYRDGIPRVAGNYIKQVDQIVPSSSNLVSGAGAL